MATPSTSSGRAASDAAPRPWSTRSAEQIPHRKAKQYEGANQTLTEMVNSGNAMLMDDRTVRPVVLDPNSGDHYVQMGT